MLRVTDIANLGIQGLRDSGIQELRDCGLKKYELKKVLKF